MGGHQANPAQAGQAFSGAQSAAAQNQQIGATASSNANALAANLFGTPTAGGGTTGGTLSAAANPASLNVTAPTGTFLQQYNNQNAGIANSFQQQRGALAQNLANRGFGSNSPSYFGASQAQQLGIGQAQAQNAAYTSATQAQQQQALANYQFANQMEANLYGQSLTGAVQGLDEIVIVAADASRGPANGLDFDAGDVRQVVAGKAGPALPARWKFRFPGAATASAR